MQNQEMFPKETMASVLQDRENITEVIQDVLQKEDSKNKKENGDWKGKLKQCLKNMWIKHRNHIKIK